MTSWKWWQKKLFYILRASPVYVVYASEKGVNALTRSPQSQYIWREIVGRASRRDAADVTSDVDVNRYGAATPPHTTPTPLHSTQRHATPRVAVLCPPVPAPRDAQASIRRRDGETTARPRSFAVRTRSQLGAVPPDLI